MRISEVWAECVASDDLPKEKYGGRGDGTNKGIAKLHKNLKRVAAERRDALYQEKRNPAPKTPEVAALTQPDEETGRGQNKRGKRGKRK